MKNIIKTCFIVIVVAQGAFAQQKTFTNPLLPSGADPWVIYKDGLQQVTTLPSGKQKI